VKLRLSSKNQFGAGRKYGKLKAKKEKMENKEMNGRKDRINTSSQLTQ